MSHIGEKYFFVSPNQLQGADRFRTLLGRFWHSFQGLKYGYGDHPKQKSLIQKTFQNYWNSRRLHARARLRGVSPRSRAQILKEYRSTIHDNPISKDEEYILPNKWVSIEQVFSRDLKQGEEATGLLNKYDDNAKAEIIKVTYEDSSLKYSPSVLGQTIKHAYFRKSWKTRAIVDAIVNRTLRTLSVRGTSYDDFSVELDRPIHKSITEQMNAGASNIRIATVNQECEYNYFLENFEKRILAAPEVKETEMPNIYAVHMVGSHPSRSENIPQPKQLDSDDDTYSAVSLWNEIPKEMISFRVAKNDQNALKSPRKLGKSKKKRATANSNSAYVEYLEKYTLSLHNLSQGKKEQISKKYSNILFSAKNQNILQDVNSKSKNIPACLKLDFSTPRSSHGSLTSLLGKANMSTIFMLKATEANLPSEQINPRAKKLWFDENPSFYSEKYFLDPNGKVQVNKNTSPEKMSIPSYDVIAFLKSIIDEKDGQGGLDPNTEEISTIISDSTELSTFQPLEPKSRGGDISADKLKTKMAAFILLGQLQKVMEHNNRSYSEILDGKKPHSEVVFYEVEKIKVSTNGVREVIQRFYLPNFHGSETISLVDSQIKYDGAYQYNVNAWTMVFGNTYRYVGYSVIQGTSSLGTSRNGFQMGVVNVPSIRMMRLPYCSLESIRVRDFPPIAPQVEILPFRAVNNRLILNFTPSVDNYVTNPVYLETEDFLKFENCYQSQYGKDTTKRLESLLKEEDGPSSVPLRFKSDDLPRFFEVFRIEGAPPTSWRDFENNKVISLSVEDDETSVIDHIFPNEDYYYTFRSVDVHGNVSNPSDILRVKLIDDQGIFPIIEPYDLEKNARLDRGFVKPFKRFLQITPVFEQVLYKDERQEELKKSIADQRKIRLGAAQDSIYGKVLKFRITSKKSGRKVDLNVSFKHEHKKPARD